METATVGILSLSFLTPLTLSAWSCLCACVWPVPEWRGSTGRTWPSWPNSSATRPRTPWGGFAPAPSRRPRGPRRGTRRTPSASWRSRWEAVAQSSSVNLQNLFSTSGGFKLYTYIFLVASEAAFPWQFFTKCFFITISLCRCFHWIVWSTKAVFMTCKKNKKKTKRGQYIPPPPPSNHNAPFSLDVNWSCEPLSHVHSKCFHDTFAMYLYMNTSRKTTSWESKPESYLRGFSKLSCFRHHIFIAIFRFCALLGIMVTQLMSSPNGTVRLVITRAALQGCCMSAVAVSSQQFHLYRRKTLCSALIPPVCLNVFFCVSFLPSTDPAAVG